MRIPRLLAAAMLLLIVAGAAVQEEEAASKASATEEVLMLATDLAQIRAKVSNLDLSTVLWTWELKRAEIGIEEQGARMSQDIATLQSEIASFQSKGYVAAGEQTDWANAWAIELENQIEKIQKDMEAGKKKVQELNATLERLQKTSAENKRRVQNIEHVLKVAEEELMRVQLETTTKSEQLGEVHGAWLPPWLATHMETAKEWIPVIKEKWVTAKTTTEPYVQMVSEKSVEAYEASRDAISPHVLKAHEFADPYFQEAKKLSKTYVDQVARASKPHVVKLKTTLKPYTEEAGHAYENFLGLVQRPRREPGEGVPQIPAGAARGHAHGHELPAPAHDQQGQPRVPLLAEQAQGL